MDGKPVSSPEAMTHGAALGCAVGSAPWPSPGGHTTPVSAVALGEVDGEPVVVSGSDDETVRLWDARSGQRRGGPLKGHMSGNCGGAGRSGRRAGNGFGRLGQDGAALGCAFRPAPWPAPKGPREPVTAVALGEVGGETVVSPEARPDGAALGRAFRPAPWPAPKGPQILGGVGGAGRSRRRAGNGFGRLGPYGAALGCAVRPLPGGPSPVNAMALGEVDGEPVVISRSDDNTGRLCDARSG